MIKLVFIVNGMARCGKDTFAQFVGDLVPTKKISSIDKVKNIARQCGWDGVSKTEKDRKFLSDLKVLTSEYSDMPMRYICDLYNEFIRDSEHVVLLIDIREPENIKVAKQLFNATTILIRNKNVKQINSNMADANVENYDYNYILENNGSLDEFRDITNDFMKNYLNNITKGDNNERTV